VTLYGTVPHRVMKHAIEDIVAACPGVKDIENKLTVALIAPWPQSGRKQE
jgi:osmotically-inducible protein OsmY